MKFFSLLGILLFLTHSHLYAQNYSGIPGVPGAQSLILGNPYTSNWLCLEDLLQDIEMSTVKIDQLIIEKNKYAKEAMSTKSYLVYSTKLNNFQSEYLALYAELTKFYLHVEELHRKKQPPSKKTRQMIYTIANQPEKLYSDLYEILPVECRDYHNRNCYDKRGIPFYVLYWERMQSKTANNLEYLLKKIKNDFRDGGKNFLRNHLVDKPHYCNK